MKERYLERQELLIKQDDRPLLDPPPAERIALLLDECESGNTSAWWRLNMEMTLKPDSTHYMNRLEPDLTSLPGWEDASYFNKARIIIAAKIYLLNSCPTENNWLGTNNLYWPELAAYSAFQLLLKEDPNYISAIPPSIWKKWAPIILAYPVSSGRENDTIQKELVKNAYHCAPHEIINTLMILIDKNKRNLGCISILHRLKTAGTKNWQEPY